MVTISNYEFIIELTNRYNNVYSNTIAVGGEVVFSSEQFKDRYTQIGNVTFKDQVKLVGLEIGKGILFDNCTFERGLIFERIPDLEYKSSFENKEEAIVFLKDCTISVLAFRDSELRHPIIVSDSEIQVNLYIEELTLYHRFYLNNSQVRNGLEIHKGSFKEIVIQRKSIINKMHISQSTGLSLSDAEFHGKVKIEALNNKDQLKIDNCLFRNFVSLECIGAIEFTIEDCRFEKGGVFSNKVVTIGDEKIDYEVKKISLIASDFSEGFTFSGTSKELVNLSLQLSDKSGGKVAFANWNVIKYADLTGFNERMKLTFKQCVFEKLNFLNLSNGGIISFDSCGAVKNNTNQNVLTFDSSEINHTVFNNFDFSSFNEIRLESTSFDQVYFSNVNWFKDDQVKIYPEVLFDELKNQYKREFYRQIKQGLQSRGNLIDSLEFKAREMKALRDELEASGKLKPWHQDWWIMFFNWFNDFGLNWGKAAGSIVGLNVVFYLLTIPLFTKELCYSCSTEFSISAYWNALCDNHLVFAELFNPVRRFASVYNVEEVSFGFPVLDLLHRVFLGILIFQLIRAFRKYVGK